MSKHFALMGCVLVLGGAAWFGTAGSQVPQDLAGWSEVAPGVLRTNSVPYGYALIDGENALLIDAPQAGAGLMAKGIKTIDAVLLTHYHRGSVAAVGDFLKKGIKVRAATKASEWLTPDAVAKYWQTSIPLRGSRTAYLVVPEGFRGIDFSLEDGQEIAWHGWTIQAVATPGHALSHLAFAVRKQKDGPVSIFCGGALAEPGKMWAPYTTDWDHWTDAGLVPSAKSLRRLAELKPAKLLPAHGPVIDKSARAALLQTAKTAEEIGFLRSFERYTKERLGNAPHYRFLAKEQAMTNGAKPWTQVSEHLFVTGNGYVLTSKDKQCLTFDPWDKRGAEQFAKLQADRKLGPLEVVMFSHAHYDHYDGIYYLPDREKFEVWMLDKAAVPVAEPFLLRAPFLDARPVKIDRRPRDGAVLTWREYRFRFRDFPGQSEFTMGVETEIDGKKCFFTADNFFHQDMFSGSGGWMGLNRSWPMPYADSAQKVLDAAPDWVLAEHGGPFEFNAEDFRRRVAWGKESARAADLLCLSANHRLDWNPHRLHFEPLVQKGQAGKMMRGKLVAANPLARAEKLHIVLEGRGLTPDQSWDMTLAAGETANRDVSFVLANTVKPGRHVFALRTVLPNGLDPSDAFLVADVE